MFSKTHRRMLLLASLIAAGLPVVFAEAPTLEPADDADHFGPPEKFLFWSPSQQVAGYRNINRIFPTRKINADGCCISATLRDYGRIGLFAMHNGKLPDGTQVLPENWMAESTMAAKGYKGYGYLWWLDGTNAFRGIGIFGQGIYVDPQRKVVVALHSARAAASEDDDWNLQYELSVALAGAVAD